MSITIELSPELERQLKLKAKQEGMNLDSFISRLLEKRFAPSPAFDKSPTQKETDLLKKINEGFPLDFWERYFQLIEKRNAAQLTQDEHKMLIELSDKVELANARRIKYLVELAELKGMDLDDVIAKLGIKPKGHA